MARMWRGVKADAAQDREILRYRAAVDLIRSRDRHRLLVRTGRGTDTDALSVSEAFRTYRRWAR